MKLTVKNIVSIMVLGSCLNFLIITQVSIWLGGTDIDSLFLLAPITRNLAQAVTPNGTDWHSMWQRLYAVSFLLDLVVYAAAFWMGNTSGKRVSARKQAVLWSVQLFCGVIGYSTLFQLLIAELAFQLPFRKALLAFLVFCVINILVIFTYAFGWAGMGGQATTGLMVLAPLNTVSFMSCFFGIGYLARIANRSHNSMAAAHAELLATQQLLAEAMRSSERMRIARELHDAIGHNLTALNLHLELATRQASEAVPASIKIARELGQQLLANVRITVSNERHDQAIDLRQALQTLCLGIPEPHIVLSIAPDFEVDIPNVAHALFCCAQEGITNAVRHANASAVNISLAKTGHSISLLIEDDGKGLDKHVEGNGLRGMRERIETLDGNVELANRPEGGCAVRIQIPPTESYP